MRTFDIVIVGAGLAGCTAAIAAARRGKSVCMIERGRKPGSKNVIGGILYTPVLDRLIPDFSSTAPVERHVVARNFSMLNDTSHIGMEMRSADFEEGPNKNHSYTIRRTEFDPWLVQKAKEAGAMVVTSTVVDSLLHEDDDPARAVVGVRCRRENGDIGAKVVILAEGANALVAEKENLRPKTLPSEAMLGVKEVLQLDRTRLEDRFALEGDAGRGYEFYGDPTHGGFGSGFVYTNRDSISVGVNASLSHLTRLKISPPLLLDRFKKHPSVAALIRGAEPIEYCAHLLPISSTQRMPTIARDGLILAGDAARFANMSHYKELTNLVTASGEAAGETACDAIDAGNTTAKGLAGYKKRLEAGFVFRDMKKYAKLPELLERSPDLLERYPRLLVDAFVTHFTIGDKPKDDVEKEMMRAWNREIKPAQARRAMMDFLDASGISLVQIMKTMGTASLKPSNWFGKTDGAHEE
jgi:electron transfer flavoprotein-quinone oxidoreductase